MLYNFLLYDLLDPRSDAKTFPIYANIYRIHRSACLICLVDEDFDHECGSFVWIRKDMHSSVILKSDFYLTSHYFVHLVIQSVQLFVLRSYHIKLRLSFLFLGRGTAVTMKNMLDNQFPGIHVVLANYPPPLPKRLLGKVVPIVQFGVIGLVMAGEQIFPRLGYAVPPPWFYQLRANRFGTMATTWLLGNFFQSMLQSSGAFEVYCNGELVCIFQSFCAYLFLFLIIFSLRLKTSGNDYHSVPFLCLKQSVL